MNSQNPSQPTTEQTNTQLGLSMHTTEKTNGGNQPLFEREQIRNSPYWIIGTKKQGYYITIGKYRINETPIQSIKQVEKWMNENIWNVITTTAIIIHNIIKDQEENKPKTGL